MQIHSLLEASLILKSAKHKHSTYGRLWPLTWWLVSTKRKKGLENEVKVTQHPIGTVLSQGSLPQVDFGSQYSVATQA